MKHINHSNIYMQEQITPDRYDMKKIIKRIFALMRVIIVQYVRIWIFLKIPINKIMLNQVTSKHAPRLKCNNVADFRFPCRLMLLVRYRNCKDE